MLVGMPNQSADSDIDPCLTYGNVLYEYCFYRQRIKFFHTKRVSLMKIRKMLDFAYDVVKVAMSDETASYIQ